MAEHEHLYPNEALINDERVPLIVDDALSKDKISMIEGGTPSQSVTKEKTYFEVFFIVMPLFCGYACLFALQREIKTKYNIKDNSSELSHLYGVAASLVYIGNFIFRLGHNIFFCFMQPKNRVIISMISMSLSMGTISLIFFALKDPSLAWVFVAYAFGGIGIGTFESNILSTIAPLGKSTKLWAIIAIPTGILSITVGGFFMLQLGVHPGFIYVGVLCYLVLGLIIYLARIYRMPIINNTISISEFFQQLREWRQWLPKIGMHSIALLVDMFCVSMFSPGMMLYIYDSKYVAFPWFHGRLPTDWLFVIYDAAFFIGDSLSRKIFFQVKIIFPLLFWIIGAAGVACAVSNVSFLVPFCALFVSFCNGSIYAQANRKIDSTIDKKYSLIAFSFWLFIGDIGSVIGSNLISYLSVDIHNLYHH